MKKFLYVLPVLALPLIAGAQAGSLNLNGVDNSIARIITTMNGIVPLLIGVAVLVFLWGVLKFVLAGSDDAAKRKDARGFMIWGLVSIFIMVSVWGLVGILQSSFGLSGVDSNIVIPKVLPGNN